MCAIVCWWGVWWVVVGGWWCVADTIYLCFKAFSVFSGHEEGTGPGVSIRDLRTSLDDPQFCDACSLWCRPPSSSENSRYTLNIFFTMPKKQQTCIKPHNILSSHYRRFAENSCPNRGDFNAQKKLEKRRLTIRVATVEVQHF